MDPSTELLDDVVCEIQNRETRAAACCDTKVHGITLQVLLYFFSSLTIYILPRGTFLWAYRCLASRSDHQTRTMHTAHGKGCFCAVAPSVEVWYSTRCKSKLVPGKKDKIDAPAADQRHLVRCFWSLRHTQHQSAPTQKLRAYRCLMAS